MMIYITTGTHCAHPTILRRHFGTYSAACEAAVDMVNLLREHIGQDKLPPVSAEEWQQGLREAQRERLRQLGEDVQNLDSDDLATQAECDVWIERANVDNIAPFPVLGDRELAAILAALRLLQRQSCPADLVDIVTKGDTVTALDPGEIDGLCERLNGADGSDDVPRIVVAIEGGLVSGVVTDRPVILHTVDYDIEGAGDDEISLVPQDEHDPVEAIVNRWSDVALTVDPDWVSRVETALIEAPEA